MAEEVISNIRTVRGFAMEEHECEKFGQEVEITARLFKKLGFGIALFQVPIQFKASMNTDYRDW